MEEQRQSWGSLMWEIVKFAIITLIIVIPIRMFVVKPFIVNGESMDQTFANGQYLLVDELTYRFEKPQRGDVIVFQYPYNPTIQYYIKRIIGLPGDTVRIDNGVVTIINKDNPNGFTLNEPYVTLHSYDNLAPTTLSSTQYFVLGDNRPASSDSRFWGDLDSKYIVGKPLLRLVPLDELGVYPGQARYMVATSSHA
jgi:signal peptidase I